MDVRQFTFLVRQPSAALKPRDTFWGLSKRGLAFMLANMMFWQPLVAMADGIVVNGSATSVGQAGNGVPVINIATPNAAGLSHNRFSDYNVGQQGVILNNATERTQATQLGGFVVGNDQLHGRAANVILNEVNGTRPSQLNGYTEVAGQSAHVIVANPYGITCNGCGFLNTPRATLTTGRPVIENGQVQRYQVEQGSVAIEGAGLNASNVDQFEIITRSARINAQLQARHLAVVAGANDVDAQSLKATARAANPADAPQLAIDSSALGGMYAGAITLVGTEAGVGVKLDGQLIASGGDIQLDANGQLRLAEAKAQQGAVKITAGQLDARGAVYAGTDLQVKTQGDLDNRQTLAAAGRVSLDSGARLSNHGVIEAGVNPDSSRNSTGDVQLRAQRLDNRGQSVVASRDLHIDASQTLDNQGGTLSAQRQLTASAQTLDNRGGGRLLSAGRSDLQARHLQNGQGGLIKADGAIDARVGQLDNNGGELSSQGTLSAQVASLDNQAGTLTAGQHLNLVASGALNNQGGRVSSQQTLDLTAGQVDNSSAGRIAAGQALAARVSGLDQHAGGHLTSAGTLSLDLGHGHLDNQGGLIRAPAALQLLNLASVDNRGGEIASAAAFTLQADSLDNGQGKLLGEQALTVRLARALDNRGGLLAAMALDIGAASLDNQGGRISATQGLALQLGGGLDNRHGEILGASTTLGSTSLDNRQGLVQGGQQLTLEQTGTLLNREGRLLAGQALTLGAASLDNSQGTLTSEGMLHAVIQGQLLNQAGLLAGNTRLQLHAASLDNQAKGRITAKQALALGVGQFDNRGGSVSAQGTLHADGARLDNREGGLVSSGQAMTLAVQAVDNRAGEVSSATDLTLLGAELDNSSGGRLLANGDLRLTLQRLDNHLKGLVSGQRIVDLQALQLDNSEQGSLYAKHGLSLHLGAGLDNRQGTLRSDAGLTLQAANADNDGGRVSSAEPLVLSTTGAFSNQQGELLGAGTVSLNSASLDNRGGTLRGDGTVQVTTGALDNRQGQLTSAERLALVAAQVDNRQAGRIASTQALDASVTGLDQQGGGKFYSTGGLTLDLHGGYLNNASGLINAQGPLLFRQLAQVDNQGGEISSRQGFTLAARGLDNRDGKLLSDQALNIRLEQALGNVNGEVSAAGLSATAASLDNRAGVFGSRQGLDLTLTGELLNIDGEVSSIGASVIDVATLNNRDGQVMADTRLALTSHGALLNQGGTLGGKQHLQVSAASLDNRQAGSLVGDGGLTVKVDGLLDNQTEGSLQTKGVIDLQAAQLDNRGGTLRADQGQVLRVGELDNRQGVLNSKQGLTLSGQQLRNQQGLLSAEGPLTLTLDAIDNGKGRIFSKNDLRATVGVLAQQGGELLAQGELALTGSSLDNRDGGMVGASKALQLKVERIDNRGGELSGQTDAELVGQHLDNSAGKLLAGTRLRLTVAELVNQAKGLVFGQDVQLAGARLDNAGGRFGAGQSMTLQLAAGLDNSAGKLTSEGTLDLHGQRIDNSDGRLSSGGALTLVSAGELINQGGVVESAQALALTSASLDNRRQGLLKSEGGASLDSGRFDNRDGGRVIAAGSLDLKAAHLDNDGRIASAGQLTANLGGLTQQGGELSSSTRLDLDMNGADLRNGGVLNAPLLVLKQLGDVDNQHGEISSQQAFILAARSLDNSQGKLVSDQALTLRVEQLLSNLKGRISANGLDSRSAGLANADGMISSLGGLQATVDGLLDNQRGTLVGDGAGQVRASHLDNRGGDLHGKGALSVEATRLDNQDGKLIGTDTLHVGAASLDNRNGLIGATKALELDVASLDNRAGELTSNADLRVVGQTLDNSDGGVLSADQHLDVSVARLLNRNGGQLGGQRLTLSATGLDNNGGSLRSQQPLVLRLAGELDNRDGLLSSEDTLTLEAASLDNRQGRVSSAKDLKLIVSGQVRNQHGELATDAAMTLHSASLDNQGGRLSGKGATTLATGSLNNQGGRLDSGDTLDLATGQLNNGGSIGSAKALTASVSGLDQQGGKLFSDAGLTLDLHEGQLNNQNGLINALGPLRLDNLVGVSNHEGEISSAQAFTFSAQHLDNTQGKLLSNQGLSLRIARLLDNTKGLIGAASLDARAASVDNRGGTLNSRGELLLTSDGRLDNRDQGLISAGQALTLRAMALDNRGNGLVNSQGRLELHSASLDTGSGGEVSAKGAMALDLGAIALAGGRLVGEGAVSLDLNGNDLDNRQGKILVQGPLTLARLGTINNQGGELSSQHALTLNTGLLDNTDGQLISGQVLTLNAASLLNQNGLVSGWQGLAVSGANLDNRNHGTLSSRDGALDVQLSGALLNSAAGALVSQGRLTVAAASLDNSAGILSSGAGQRLTIAGELNNSTGGLIDSGAELDLHAATLDNQGGTVNGQQAMTVTATELRNQGGTLASNASLTLELLGKLENVNGKLASGGPLLLQRATQVDNQGGQIISQGLLTLLAGSLDNRLRGTLASKGRVQVSTTGILRNDNDGLIYSEGADLQVTAAELSNRAGLMQGQGGLGLAIGGELDNQGGKLLARAGDVAVKASSLSNQAGTLASLEGLLRIEADQALLNGQDAAGKGGVLHGQRLDLTAGSIDNQHGRIAAQGGDALITSAAFANANGGLYASHLARLKGATLDNAAGQIAAGRVELGLSGLLGNRAGVIESDSILALKASSVDNQGGQLRALGADGKTDLQIGGVFDNRNGRLEARNNDFTLNVAGLRNQGGSLLHGGAGTFDVATANLLDAGGSVLTRGGLTLSADTWTNSSVIQAGRLTLNVNQLNQTAQGQLLASERLEGTGGNWNNDGLIASDGSAQLTLAGRYSGNGRYSSLGDLGLSAGQLDLGAAGSVASGQDTAVNVAGQLNNAGRLTAAANLTLTAAGLTNSGTLASGEDLTLTTPVLLNSKGLISSGGDMRLLAASFTNSYADVYGLGNVLIARDPSQAKADLLDNRSGTIESGRNLTINAATVNNVRDVFDHTQPEKKSIKITELDCNLIPGPGCDFRKKGRRNGLWQIDEVDSLTVTRSSAAGNLNSGADLLINAQVLNNRSSAISATGNLTANAVTINNDGLQAEEIKTSRKYWNYVKQIHDAIPAAAAFNARNASKPSATVEADLSSFLSLMGGGLLSKEVTHLNGDGQAYDAVIQAGGNVALNAAQNINNSVIRPYYAYVAAGRTKTDTGAGSGYSTQVSINAQLPPDLAKQQVNPVTLPGFSLPTSQNGLFRLSEQGASSAQATQGSSASTHWTLGGASVDLAQRQQQPDSQGRTLQLDAVAPLTASTREVTVAAREAAGIDTRARVIDVAGVGSAEVGTLVPVHSQVGEIARVESIEVQAPGTVAEPTPQLTRPTFDLPGQALQPQPAPTVVAAAEPTAVPAPVASQAISRVQGLPERQAQPQPHKYLVETNPALTELKQFMSSDYLLANLGYNPDESAKRLGDGFYEQRLIRQAVMARTGQRFIDGQDTDEKLFKYLMDNAIKSKQQLNLAVGVSLSAEQVAALTHDIVWLEKTTVHGEEVLTPVLYLAHANQRLAPNGALIAGSNVNLIAGQNLDNAGTLRALEKLTGTAGNDLSNSGLIESGGRLDLLAGNNIVNKAGGIIAGRDVSLVASNGSVLNERSVTVHQSSDGSISERTDFLDSAARIEAANDLSVKAGRDFVNRAGVLQSGRDLTLQAGRDLSLEVVEQVGSNANAAARHNSSTITQHGSLVTAGRDLSAVAGRDLAAIASQIEAKRDVAMSAVAGLSLIAAANEQHSAVNTKKLKAREDHVQQVSTTVKAGGDVALVAGQDLAMSASRVEAGDEAYLVAGGRLGLLAAEDSDYSLYDKKKKGSFGSKKTQRDEVTKVIQVGSEVISGGNQTLQSGGDQLYQAAKLDSGQDISIASGGAVTFEAVKDLQQESHQKSKSDLAWTSAKGKGHTDETLRQTQMVARGKLAISAVDGLNIDIKQIDQKSVHQAIDAMVQADPKLAWLKDAEQRGDVDWRQVQELHESFKYSNSSLGQGAMLAIIIVVTVLTAGVASTAVGSVAGATAGSGSVMAAGIGASASTATAAAATTAAATTVTTAATTAAATTATTAATATAAAGWGNVMASSVLTGMASKGAVSFINNGGNLGATFKDVTSSQNLRGYASGALTAGFTAGVLDNAFGVTGDNVNRVTKGFDLSKLSDIGKFTAYSAAQGAAQASFSTALQGGSLGDNLRSSLASQAQGVLRGVAFNAVGDFASDHKWADASLEKTALHALVGGLLSEAEGKGFATGALAAGANEALSDGLSKLVKGDKQLELMASQLVGLTSAAMIGGDLQTGIDIAKDATAYNRQLHPEEKQLIKEKAAELTRERGQPKLEGFTWEELLTLASDSQLDNSAERKYNALRAALKADSQQGNPLIAKFDSDMKFASTVVQQMSELGMPLHWKDGSVITAHGKEVRAFQATAEQKADSQLFASNGSGSLGPMAGNLQGDAERFGAETAVKRHSEIGLFKGSSDASDTTMQRVRDSTIGGLKDFTLLDVMPLGRAASVGGKAAAAVEAKVAEQVGEAALKGGATYVESKVIQANTTVQLSEAVTLAGGKVLPKGSVVTVADDTMKVVYPNGVSEIGSYGKAVGQPLALPGANGAKATLPAATDLGKVSFDAANGVGTIYSPKVTMNAGEVIFDDFAVGTSKGFIGYGPDGASELVGPLKKLLEYTQSQGAKTVTLKGYYASEEGAALGAGKVGEKFSFSFPSTKEGLRDFLRGLKQ
ncbi:MAG: filamentous hemagglutinin N-terminal domain-containing protein [Paucimonas sp.]|nr:filamentous hemagglutinin N-terminal domain-containing protein [Paucimonas sp.]